MKNWSEEFDERFVGKSPFLDVVTGKKKRLIMLEVDPDTVKSFIAKVREEALREAMEVAGDTLECSCGATPQEKHIEMIPFHSPETCQIVAGEYIAQAIEQLINPVDQKEELSTYCEAPITWCGDGCKEHSGIYCSKCRKNCVSHNSQSGVGDCPECKCEKIDNPQPLYGVDLEILNEMIDRKGTAGNIAEIVQSFLKKI